MHYLLHYILYITLYITYYTMLQSIHYILHIQAFLLHYILYLSLHYTLHFTLLYFYILHIHACFGTLPDTKIGKLLSQVVLKGVSERLPLIIVGF